MTHTSGPWHYERTDAHHVCHSGTVCDCTTICNIGDGEFSEANAHLIAAAPDLLEALEAIATGRDKDGMKVDFPQDIARAAIAKAKGQSNE